MEAYSSCDQLSCYSGGLEVELSARSLMRCRSIAMLLLWAGDGANSYIKTWSSIPGKESELST